MKTRVGVVRRPSLYLLLLALGALDLLTSTSARADGSSSFTLGLGAGVGMHSEATGGEATRRVFVNQANVRLKLFFLGVDYAYDLQRDGELVTPAEDLQYRAKMRLTGLIYPYSGELLAFYLGVGVGGTQLAELGRLGADGNSYHGGVGLELHVADHLTIELSFMLVAPGVASIKRSAVADIAAAYATGSSEALLEYRSPTFDRYLSLDNHEAMLRIMLYL
jgi:hypothetical protein